MKRVENTLLSDGFIRISLGGGPTGHAHTAAAPRSGTEEEMCSFVHRKAGKAGGFHPCRSTRRPLNLGVSGAVFQDFINTQCLGLMLCTRVSRGEVWGRYPFFLRPSRVLLMASKYLLVASSPSK